MAFIKNVQFLKSGVLDASGLPLTFGIAHFYDVGTTTYKTAVYRDRALEYPLPNPLTLDSAGKGQAFISGTAKIKVTDASGTEIFTLETYGLDEASFDAVTLAGITTGDGITTDGSAVSFNPDDSTLEVNGSNKVAILDNGITATQIDRVVSPRTLNPTTAVTSAETNPSTSSTSWTDLNANSLDFASPSGLYQEIGVYSSGVDNASQILIGSGDTTVGVEYALDNDGTRYATYKVGMVAVVTASSVSFPTSACIRSVSFQSKDLVQIQAKCDGNTSESINVQNMVIHGQEG